MHTSVIQTNKRRTHAQSNYANTKSQLKAWFRHLLRRLARKRSGPILQPWMHTGNKAAWNGCVQTWKSSRTCVNWSTLSAGILSLTNAAATLASALFTSLSYCCSKSSYSLPAAAAAAVSASPADDSISCRRSFSYKQMITPLHATFLDRSSEITLIITARLGTTEISER